MERINGQLALERFSHSYNSDGDVVVEGFAIHPGLYHTYTRIEESEIKNFTKSIKNAAFLKDHVNATDNAVGRVTFSQTRFDENAGVKGTYYRAFIDSEETKLLRKVDKGIVQSTSVGFSFEPYCSICGKHLLNSDCPHWTWDEGFEVLAKECNCHELSAIPVPADEKATVSAMKLEEQFGNDIAGLKRKRIENLKQKDNNKSENMTNFEKEAKDLELEVTELKLKLKEELETLEAKKEEEKTEALGQLKKDSEEKIQTKVEEVVLLKQEKEALEGKVTELSKELDTLKAEVNKAKEAELKENRKKVFELSEQVGAGLTEEEVEQLSEDGLNRYIDMFSGILEKTPVLKREHRQNDQYEHDGDDEEKTPAEGVFGKIRSLSY